MSNKKIEIVTAVATLIEPGKKYIISVSNKDLTMDDLDHINKQLKDWGAESCVVVLRKSNDLKVIEVG
jgi:hypothetical protein